MRRLIFVAGLAFALLGGASSSWAQLAPEAGQIFDRGADRLPGLDDESAADAPPPTLDWPTGPLPTLEGASESTPFELSEGVRVRGFRMTGSTVFSESELAEAVAPFLGRPLRSEDLPLLTDALTRLYVDRGYVSSGARLPDQSLADGILEIQIIEGQLVRLELEDAGGLPRSWIEGRLRRALRTPLDLNAIERGLRTLQLDERVARVDGILEPTATLGESVLRLRIEAANPWSMSLRAANDVSPALGGKRGEVRLAHANVLGFGDRLRIGLAGAEGLFDFEVGYRVPITPWLTEAELFGDLGRGEIVAGDFAEGGFNFRSEVERYGILVNQPLLNTLSDDLDFSFSFERRRSRVEFIGNQDLQLETANEEDGRVSLSLFRTSLEWVHRESAQVVALRLRGTFGVDTWDATAPNATAFGGPSLPDGEFQSGLLQLQYARRFDAGLGDGELVLRGDAQLASGALFSLEALSVGGLTTVRGYHENELLADNGVIASAELRLPIFPRSLQPHDLRLVPFVDFASIWDDGARDQPDFEREIASAGLGFLYRYAERFEFNGFFGVPLTNRPRDQAGDRLQNIGLHLEARIFVF